MRHTQTSVNNISEHTDSDIWTAANGVNISEKWTGTTRFQILRTRLPEGLRRVNGRPTKIQKTTRPDSIWPEAWTRLSQNQRDKRNGRMGTRRCQTASSTPQRRNLRGIDRDYFKVIADARLKLEKDTALALPCIVKEDSRGKPQAGTTSIDAGEEQSYSENKGSSGKVNRRRMDHIAEKCMWEAFTMVQYTSQFPFKKL